MHFWQTLLFIVILIPCLLYWLGLPLWDLFPEDSQIRWVPDRSAAMMYILLMWGGLVLLTAGICRWVVPPG